MASSPITSWQIHGENLEAVTDFMFLGSKSTTDRDRSHEKKNTTQHNTTKQKSLLLGRKAMTNQNSILKSRDTTLPTRVLIGKATVFLVVMYGYESWTITKAGCQRIDAFEL